MPQTFMRPFIVVVESPRLGHLANLDQGLKQVGVQELVTERTIEAFSKSVLLRLALLDINYLDAMLLAPVGKGT